MSLFILISNAQHIVFFITIGRFLKRENKIIECIIDFLLLFLKNDKLNVIENIRQTTCRLIDKNFPNCLKTALFMHNIYINKR